MKPFFHFLLLLPSEYRVVWVVSCQVEGGWCGWSVVAVDTEEVWLLQFDFNSHQRQKEKDEDLFCGAVDRPQWLLPCQRSEKQALFTL